MRDEKKIVSVKLEPVESASVCTDAASADAVSLHTASCFQRSARTTGRRSGAEKTHMAAARASAPAPFAVSVRFQFVVIVCLLRFPAVVPVAVPPGDRLPGPLLRRSVQPPSIKFKSKNHVQAELSFSAALRRSSVPSGFLSASALPSPGSRQARIKFGWPVFRRPFFRFTTRSWPPVPLVCCSFRSWSVSQVRFVFSSARFGLPCSVLFSSSCSSLLVSVRSSVSFVCFVLSSFHALCPLTGDLFYIILAYIIHD